MNVLVSCMVLLSTALLAAPLPEDFLLIAHRGVVDEGLTENSLPALEATIARGYTHIEVDIRSTRDGHPVCLHDESLLRTAKVDRRIGEVTLTELHELVPEETVPSLATFCAKAAGRIELMPDLKGCPAQVKEVFLKRLDEILTRHDLLKQALFIGRLDLARTFEDRARLAWRLPLDRTLASPRVEEADFSERYFVFNHGDDFDEESVRGFQALGLPVIVSINTGHYKTGDPIAQGLAHVETMLALGVDGLQIDSVYDASLRLNPKSAP